MKDLIYPNIIEILKARQAQHEATMTANIGAYPVGFRGVQRRQVPSTVLDCDGQECAYDHEMWKILTGR